MWAGLQQGADVFPIAAGVSRLGSHAALTTVAATSPASRWCTLRSAASIPAASQRVAPAGLEAMATTASASAVGLSIGISGLLGMVFDLVLPSIRFGLRALRRVAMDGILNQRP